MKNEKAAEKHIWTIRGAMREKLKFIAKEFPDDVMAAGINIDPTGKVKNHDLCAVETLPRLADAMHVSISFLFTGKEIGEAGGLRIDDLLFSEFHNIAKALPTRSRKILSSVVERLCYHWQEKEYMRDHIRDLTKLFRFPDYVEREITDYYGMAPDIYYSQCNPTLKPDNCLNYMQLATSTLKSIDSNVCLAISEGARLPLGALLGWDYPVKIYSDDADADFLLQRYMLIRSDARSIPYEIARSLYLREVNGND